MNEQSRRKELSAQYRQTRPEAGVYRIVNTRTGKGLVGSATNLTSIRNKVEFARSSNTPGVLDHRIASDVKQFGIDSFSFEVLEVLEIRPEATEGRIQEDLAALETLWREKLGTDSLY